MYLTNQFHLEDHLQYWPCTWNRQCTKQVNAGPSEKRGSWCKVTGFCSYHKSNVVIEGSLSSFHFNLLLGLTYLLCLWCCLFPPSPRIVLVFHIHSAEQYCLWLFLLLALNFKHQHEHKQDQNSPSYMEHYFVAIINKDHINIMVV